MSPEDLDYRESCRVIDQIAEYAPLILVLSGGEPLWRKDVFDLAQRARRKGLRVALATNGTLVDEAMAERIKASGIERVSVSLDGVEAGVHDGFRGVAGAFDSAVRGLQLLKGLGVPTQINSTVTRHNAAQLPQMVALAEQLGVVAFHLFLLVPVGCGLTIAEEQAIRGEEAEQILTWFYQRSTETSMELKATCAPHYYRIVREQRADSRRAGVPLAPLATHGMHAMTKGCLAGSGVCFISHLGEVYPCGYLPVSAGNLREESFRDIWEHAEIFESLRETGNLEGKCGVCEFQNVCSGCRARAFGVTGNYLAEEPSCIYQPSQIRAAH
jgi:radical SAM protein with 4Fe4S-binding SPASM domain